MGPLTGSADQSVTGTQGGNGNWFSGALDWITTAAGKVTDFIAGLPNEIINFGNELGGRIYDPNSQAAREAREFHQNRLLGEIGPIILLGGAALLIVALSKKK